MKLHDKTVSKMILKKSSNYLNHAIIMFVLTVAVLGYSLLYLVNYVAQNNYNFKENDNVHVIKLDGKEQDGRYSELDNGDYQKIQEILPENKSRFIQIPFFAYIGASEYSSGEPIKILGIDKTKSSLLGDMEMKEMEAYSSGNLKNTIELSVPVIDETDDGGFVSREEVRYSLHNDKSVYKKSVFTVLREKHNELNEVFVTEDTFLRILKDVKRVPESTKDLYSEQVQERVSIENIFVYVEDLYQVDYFAELLKDKGYDVTYTFEAFDSLGSSIQKATLFLAVLIIALLVTSASNVILSFINYLRMQQKDIGILKFNGFSEKRIYRMYKRNIDVLFSLIGGGLCMYIIILGYIILGTKYYLQYIGISLLVLMLVYSIRIIVLNYGLKKIVKKDLIYLIKMSKEFE